MRILIDECVDPRVKALFPGHEAKTVHDMGWDQLADGPLLELAEQAFDVLITIDRNLEDQQNLGKVRRGVVVARGSKEPDALLSNGPRGSRASRGRPRPRREINRGCIGPGNGVLEDLLSSHRAPARSKECYLWLTFAARLGTLRAIDRQAQRFIAKADLRPHFYTED